MNADRRTILKMCATGVLAQSLHGESALAQTAHRFPTAEITMSERTCSAWAHTTLHVWPEKYLLVSLPTSAVPEAAKIVALSTGTFAALVLERDEVSLTLPESVWSAHAMKASAQDGPYRAVSFDLNLGLEVFGYFAPAAVRLANEGISIVPQSAYLKDHVLVHDKDLDKTVATLENLIKDCKQAK
jgi:hypothetical protein